MSKVADAVRETRSSLSTVFSNPGLRKLNLAFAGSAIGDWAYATAITIWAYEYGGARAVGIWYTVRLILMTFVTPFASTLVDRLPRKLVMVTTDLLRALIAFSVAAMIWADVAPMAVFVLATLSSLVAAPFRPAVAALLPKLVRTPEELTAANGTTSTIESLSFFLGPAIGGLLVTAFDVPVVVVFNALTFVWSAALVSRIVVPEGQPATATVTSGGDAVDQPATAQAANAVAAAEHAGSEHAASEHEAAEHGAPVPAAAGVVAGRSTDGGDPPAALGEEKGQSFFSESMEGFRTIWRHPDLRLVSGVYSAQTIVAGASVVFGVEMAVQMTPFGANGVGYLDSMLGIGALLGGLVAIARASAGRLATDFGVGVVFWALPLLLAAIWPHMGAAFLAMFIIGMANPVVDVNAATILQRKASDEVMGRVFGALDTALIGAMAVGSAVMPLLVHWLGLRWAMAALAIMVTLTVLPAFGRLRSMDATLREPEGLTLLRQVPLFAPLDAKSLETIAQQLVRVEVPAGEAVIREGEEGDRFYVIQAGALTASFHGEVLSHMGPGDPFGEIALLRDVPRTATVTADEASTLMALDRQVFLDAMSGNTDASTRADDLISRRIPTY